MLLLNWHLELDEGFERLPRFDAKPAEFDDEWLRLPLQAIRRIEPGWLRERSKPSAQSIIRISCQWTA